MVPPAPVPPPGEEPVPPPEEENARTEVRPPSTIGDSTLAPSMFRCSDDLKWRFVDKKAKKKKKKKKNRKQEKNGCEWLAKKGASKKKCKKYKDKKGKTAAEACGCVCGDFR